VFLKIIVTASPECVVTGLKMLDSEAHALHVVGLVLQAAKAGKPVTVVKNGRASLQNPSVACIFNALLIVYGLVTL
jgi:hypothetical protein